MSLIPYTEFIKTIIIIILKYCYSNNSKYTGQSQTKTHIDSYLKKSSHKRYSCRNTCIAERNNENGIRFNTTDNLIVTSMNVLSHTTGYYESNRSLFNVSQNVSVVTHTATHKHTHTV